MKLNHVLRYAVLADAIPSLVSSNTYKQWDELFGECSRMFVESVFRIWTAFTHLFATTYHTDFYLYLFLSSFMIKIQEKNVNRKRIIKTNICLSILTVATSSGNFFISRLVHWRDLYAQVLLMLGFVWMEMLILNYVNIEIIILNMFVPLLNKVERIISVRLSLSFKLNQLS